VDEPATEIGQEKARRTKRFFTAQLGGLAVVMVVLALVAISNISKGENTGWWVALLVAEPVVLAGLMWLARISVDEARHDGPRHVGPVRRGLLIAGGLLFVALGASLLIVWPEQLDEAGRHGMPGWIAAPGCIAIGVWVAWRGWTGKG